MSVQTELQRIIQAKADIIDSIEAKGVTVPSGTTIDNLDDYVDQIQQGGPTGEPDYFYIENTDTNNNSIRISVNYANSIATSYQTFVIDGLEYSFDKIIWTKLPDIKYGSAQTISIPGLSKVYFRHNGIICSKWQYKSGNYYYDTVAFLNFTNYNSSSIVYNIGGDISTLISESGNTEPVNDYCYSRVFKDFTGLHIINNDFNLSASKYIPASAFLKMFSGCTGLTTVPSGLLPATTLTHDGCYQAMFQECTSLTNIPNLPATTLSKSCYWSMFQGCTGITEIPTGLLPATTVIDNCYTMMFSGCTGITTIKSGAMSATTISGPGCYEMFSGCSGLTTIESNAFGVNNFTSGSNAMISMFRNCTSLVSVPVDLLPATSLRQSCYSGMFQGCTSLTNVPNLPATTLHSSCYYNMFYGCTSLTSVPTNLLPATTITASNCYYGMFQGCTSLTNVPNLPATTLHSNCYQNMFNGCISLTSVPTNLLPATTLAGTCYANMFQNCVHLTTAPELPALTLQNQCYNSMFQGCTRLNYVKAMFTTDISSSTSYTNTWLSGVATTGTFVKNANATWSRTDATGIPSGWTVQTETPAAA